MASAPEMFGIHRDDAGPSCKIVFGEYEVDAHDIDLQG
jgi:hypothetical protein